MSVKRRWGDRRDGVRVRCEDRLHVLTPYLLPNRCDNEVFVMEKIDMAASNNYLKKKNAENPEYKYTIFQIVVTAAMKTFMLRPRLNRFIMGKRLYQRNVFSAGFPVKKAFEDNGELGLAYLEFEENSNLDWFNNELHDIVYEERHTESIDRGTNVVNWFTNLPRPILTFLIKSMYVSNYFGIAPDSITKEDVCSTTCIFSNLGSIGLQAGYHHLYSWGTNSNFVMIGEKKESYYLDKNGDIKQHETLEFGYTADDRITDGYYFSESLKLFKYLLEHPTELEKPLIEEVDYDEK
ncbi:MAG: 2-oxo acid dehydrogenase subunit E2 [Peptostreptococcaceae bacterium]|nr:2-oxo acid dehydrogenase subunit E2 [Peptostreptococcaceae bacterium]